MSYLHAVGRRRIADGVERARPSLRVIVTAAASGKMRNSFPSATEILKNPFSAAA
ncbi:hypothetical protein AM571_PC01496 (plasmid) [Rhizobium etli 8C-3]|uniref:Uncharacterized protein n=1 Tax=Rhizobium etli 8C-3 TaxID=538025 RepID=A0A1L5PG99_RHIET|nr:hypothetical protein AM571_PC01496 [Rhizobium etli 8C-3]